MTASFLNDLAPTARNNKSAQELWDGKRSKWNNRHLIEFGRVGLVKIKTKITGKLDDKAEAMIMVGCGNEYPVGTYKFYNPKTNRFVFSDSVTCCRFKRWEIHPSMDGIYLQAKNMNGNGIGDYDGKMAVDLEDEEAERQAEAVEVELERNDGKVNVNLGDDGTLRQTESMEEEPERYLRRSKRLAGIPADGPSVSDGVNKVTGDTVDKTIHMDEGVGIVNETEPREVNFIFNTSINSDPGEPKSIFEALNGSDKKWWKLSGIAEVNNFLSRGAWKFVLKSSVPDRKLIGTKVVFKKKDEADRTIRFKTRIVTLGYMQIPGVDYTEKFNPVACDTSIRIVFALILFYYDSHGWRAQSMDVEAAFLEGKMNQPPTSGVNKTK